MYLSKGGGGGGGGMNETSLIPRPLATKIPVYS